MTYTHVSAPTQFVQANGIRFAYRRFGKGSAVPLLFMQHFRAGMDHWDLAVTDGFAKDRPVILFDNAGVASSSGETPDTIDAMTEHAADFLKRMLERAGHKSGPRMENVMSSAESRLKMDHTIQLSGAAGVLEPTGSESRQKRNTITPSQAESQVSR
jgi:hypothetical protein